MRICAAQITNHGHGPRLVVRAMVPVVGLNGFERGGEVVRRVFCCHAALDGQGDSGVFQGVRSYAPDPRPLRSPFQCFPNIQDRTAGVPGVFDDKGAAMEPLPASQMGPEARRYPVGPTGLHRVWFIITRAPPDAVIKIHPGAIGPLCPSGLGDRPRTTPRIELAEGQTGRVAASLLLP